MPQFANSISQRLSTTRDVIAIVKSYKTVAGPEFAPELDRMLTAMQTGNYEQSLVEFESRIGSPALSDIVRGLIGVMRGDDQQVYFRMICMDMRQIEQERLQKEAEKRPRAISKYSMMMLLSMLLLYGVVIGMQIIDSVGVLF